MIIGKVKNISDYVTLKYPDAYLHLDYVKELLPAYLGEVEGIKRYKRVAKFLKEYQKKEEMVKSVNVDIIFRRKEGVKKRLPRCFNGSGNDLSIYSYLEQGKSLFKEFKTITQDSGGSTNPEATLGWRTGSLDYCYYTLSNCGGNKFKLSIKFKAIFTIGWIFERRYLIEKDEDILFSIEDLGISYGKLPIKDNKWLTDNEIFDLFKDYIERDEYTHIERDEHWCIWRLKLKEHKRTKNDIQDLLEKDIPPKPKERLQIYFNTMDPFTDGVKDDEVDCLLEDKFENIINKISGSKTDREVDNSLFIWGANLDKVYEALKPELEKHKDKFGGYKLWFSYKDPSKDKELEI